MKIVAAIIGGLVLAAIVFVVTLLLVRVVWAWVIPDLFPGAVEQGLIAKTLSWYTAFKLAILVAVFGGLARATSGNKSEVK